MLQHRHQDGSFPADIRELCLISFDVFYGGFGRSMHGVVSQIQEERILLVAINEFDRFFGEPVGQIPFVIDALFVPIDRAREFPVFVAP